MELLVALPWIVIFTGAFYLVRHARSSITEASTLGLVGLWALSIGVPAAIQAVAAAVFAPPLKFTPLVWTLIDGFGMWGGAAQFVADVICRTIGAGVGLVLVFIVQGIWRGTRGASV